MDFLVLLRQLVSAAKGVSCQRKFPLLFPQLPVISVPDHVAAFDGHHLLRRPTLGKPAGGKDGLTPLITDFHAQIGVGEEIAVFPVGRNELAIQKKLQPEECAANGDKNQLRVRHPESAGIIPRDIGGKKHRHHLRKKLLPAEETGFHSRAVNPEIRQQKFEGAEKKKRPVADFIGMHRLRHRKSQRKLEDAEMEIVGQYQKRVGERQGQEAIEDAAFPFRNPGSETAHISKKKRHGRHEHIVAIPKIADQSLRVRRRHMLCQPHQHPADGNKEEEAHPFPHGRIIKTAGKACLPQNQEKKKNRVAHQVRHAEERLHRVNPKDL